MSEASGFFAVRAGFDVCIANVLVVNIRQNVTRFAFYSQGGEIGFASHPLHFYLSSEGGRSF